MLKLSTLFILGLRATASVSAVSPKNSFAIPEGRNLVEVKMIDANTALNPASFYWNTHGVTVPAAPIMNLAGYAFLIQHSRTGRRIMFDLGTRKDIQNLSPKVLSIFKSVDLTPDGHIPFYVTKDVPDQLVAGNVSLSSIDTVIWSHVHFDHIGDMSKLPNTTNLLVGEGTKAAAFPGYPADPDSMNLATDFEGHNMTEVKWDGVKIAGQRTHDFFGDGSFYLVDLPGHTVGHVGALARVSVNPSTFILLAGDAEHHPALMRPTPDLPLPKYMIKDLPPALQAFGAPEYADPFLLPSPPTDAVDADPILDYNSVEKLKRFDARDDVWVIISHDPSLKTAVPGTKAAKDKDAITLFPANLNDWSKKGWKESSRFAFLQANNWGNVFQNSTQGVQAIHNH